MKHGLELAQGYYKPEITGALKKVPAERYKIENFIKTNRVQLRFHMPFNVTYDSIVSPIKAEGNEGGGEEAAAETGGAAQVPAGSDALTAAPASASDTAARAKSEMISSFRAQCDAQCRQELEARLLIYVFRLCVNLIFSTQSLLLCPSIVSFPLSCAVPKNCPARCGCFSFRLR